jgi:hypothetical protein
LGCWDRWETGVDSAPLPLSLRPVGINPLVDGWPSRVRAVDAPAWQDVPAWEGKCGLALLERGPTEPAGVWSKGCRAPLTLPATDAEGCGSDCQCANSVCRQPTGDTPRSGSPLSRCGRSPVVFTEGSDLGPMDRGRGSEACEIGGLGTRARWALQPDRPPGWTDAACAGRGRL